MSPLLGNLYFIVTVPLQLIGFMAYCLWRAVYVGWHMARHFVDWTMDQD